MAIQSRLKYLVAKTEVTYGTNPTPAGTDAMLVKDLTLSPYLGNTVSRDLNRGYLGAQENINTAPYQQLTFSVEIAGSDTAGTAPAYDALLLACGLSETTAASTSNTYAPVSSSFDSVTLQFIHGSGTDGQLHTLTGCRGNVEFNFTAGELPRMNFTFMGKHNAPVNDASPLTIDTSAFVTPLPVNDTNTTTASIHSTAVYLRSFNFNLGNQVEFRTLVGNTEIVISDRQSSATAVIEAPLIATKDWFALVRSDNGVTTGAFSLVHGTTGGNIGTFAGTTVQLSDISFSEANGITEYSIPMQFLPTSAGNDEFSFVLT